MKTSKYTEEQIAFALRQAETGTRVPEVCRKMGISEQTFYRWKKKYAGLGVSELRRLRQLEEENKQLWLDQFLGEVRSDDYIARK
jgi:putative transposase